ncbi:Cytochrome P450 6B1 [Halotydeus destructor]|nr:Cytochrome P450 6B1 [Halotydeus destructor]
MLFAISTCAIILWLYYRHRLMTVLQRGNIPGPPAHFIFGNSAEFAAKGMKQCFHEWTDKYGPVVGFYLGGHASVLVTDLDLLRYIQTRDFHLFGNKNPIIKGGSHPTSSGQKVVVWQTGDDWKRTRLATSKMFTSSKLKVFADTVKHNVDLICAMFEEESHGLRDEFNISSCFKQMTFANMTETQFSLKVDLQTQNGIKKALDEAITPGLKGILAALQILFPEFEFIVWPIRRVYEEIREYLLWSPESIIINLARNILAERRQTGTSRKDMLDYMLKATKDRIADDDQLEMAVQEKLNVDNEEHGGKGQLYTDEEISSSLFVNMLAGYETTASVMSCMSHCLTNNPDVQEKIREEVKQLLIQDGVLDYNTVNGLPLLEAFMKETLRLFPPLAPFVNRTADTDYRYNDMTIPAGAGIFVGVHRLHNDETSWPEPSTFDPERFLGKQKVEAMAFQPFGAGPRNCVGMRFAILQIKLVMAELLLRYRFQLGPSSEIGDLKLDEQFIVSVPKQGVRVKLARLSASQ